MAILFVASESYELKPFASRLAGCRSLNWPLDYAEEGLWDGQRAILVANGAGPRLAAEAAEVARRAVMVADLSASRLEAIVSIGVCGALNPSLSAGQVFCAQTVNAIDVGEVFQCRPIESVFGFVSGVAISTDRVAGTVEEKKKLREQGGDVVEMEAAGVAAKAIQAGIPFCCIKVVSDAAEDAMPLDLNEMRTIEGRFARGKIGSYAVTHPNVLPGLLRLKRRADDAAGVLGDFLGSCRIEQERTPVE
jgi:adenosylhomocysteine nucleosidase